MRELIPTKLAKQGSQSVRIEGKIKLKSLIPNLSLNSLNKETTLTELGFSNNLMIVKCNSGIVNVKMYLLSEMIFSRKSI